MLAKMEIKRKMTNNKVDRFSYSGDKCTVGRHERAN